MNKIGLYFLSLICFIGSYYLVQYALQESRESKVSEMMEDQFDEIRDEAEKLNSEEPISISMQEIAIKKTEATLKAQNNTVKRRKIAVSNFMGFYLINVRTRKEHCQSLGVDISTFTNEFKNSHAYEMAIAKQLVLKKPDDIDKLYDVAKPQFKKVIEQDMKDIGTMHNQSPSEVCMLMENNGVAIAKEMHLSKLQPAVFEVLHSEN